MASEFEVNGMEELLDYLEDGAPNAILDTLSEALSGKADEIQGKTTRLCPVDTGALRDSIDVTTTDTDLTAVAGMEYASYVDGGTRFMDAEPFFEDPITDIFDGFEDELEQDMQQALDDLET